MNLQFIQNLRNISEQQLNEAYQSARYLAFGASIYYLLFGGVLSISNMIGSILKQTFSESSRVKLALISGFIFFSALMKTLYHQHLTKFEPFDSLKYTQNTSSLRLIFAGLLVGFGSQFAVRNSNHSFGLDGIPAFNFKSIMGHFFALIAACLTHTYALHTYLPQTPRIIEINLPENITYTAYLLVFILIPFICFVISSKKSFKSTFMHKLVLILYMSLFSVGIIFGYGLMMGGFTQRKIVYPFFNLDKKWNPSMIIIYGYGLVVSCVVYLVMRYLVKKPVFGTEILKDHSPININLFIGAVIFGIGWGLGGLEPATVLLLMPLQSIKIVFYWGLPCLLGMKASHKLFEQKPQEISTPQKTS